MLHYILILLCVPSTCARFLVLQLYDFFVCYSRDVLFIECWWNGRTLRLVRKGRSKVTRELRKLNFMFLHPFLYVAQDEESRQAECNILFFLFVHIYFNIRSLHVYQIFTSYCTLHQQTSRKRNKFNSRAQ
jgi:hypothetical protein